MAIGKSHSFLVCLCFFSQALLSQAKSGLENYNLLSSGGTYNWMPVLHYESGKGGYGEIRYNYEELATVSFFAGRKFNWKGAIDCNLTPMLGISAGKFSGISPALTAKAEWGNLYFSAESQGSVSFRDKRQSFFFNWSEIGYSPFTGFFAGVAAQITISANESLVERGILLGIEWGMITFPVYIFSPFSGKRSVLVGVNFQHTLY